MSGSRPQGECPTPDYRPTKGDSPLKNDSHGCSSNSARKRSERDEMLQQWWLTTLPERSESSCLQPSTEVEPGRSCRGKARRLRKRSSEGVWRLANIAKRSEQVAKPFPCEPAASGTRVLAPGCCVGEPREPAGEGRAAWHSLAATPRPPAGAGRVRSTRLEGDQREPGRGLSGLVCWNEA